MGEGESKPIRKLAAFELYLKGLYSSRLDTREGLEEALRCFESAMREDPGLAMAYSACAETFVRGAGVLFPPSEAFRRAKELVALADELEPGSSEVHKVLGDLALRGTLDWETAESEFRQALALNPGDAEAHFRYSVLLATLQRFGEAQEELREALRANPMLTSAWQWLIELRYRSGDLSAATALAEEVRDRDPNSFETRWWTGCCYWAAGRTAEASKESEELAGPAKPRNRVSRAILLGLLGKPEEAARLVRELERESTSRYVPLGWIADLHAILGEKEKAVDALERDLREGDRGLWLGYQLPQYDPFRSEPRFVALLREYHLPTEPSARSVSSGVSEPKDLEPATT